MSDPYQTKEWKDITISDRYCLLPTMEGVKAGCLVNTKNISDTNCLEYCLNQKSLSYSKKGNLWLISKNKELLEETAKRCEDSSIADKYKMVDKDAYWRAKEIERECDILMGKLFGYPDCCVNSFADEHFEGILPHREWEKKAGKALLEGSYNPLFDYTIHVPHSISCEESLKICKNIKTCLEAYDKEAAEYLRELKRSSIERMIKKF